MGAKTSLLWSFKSQHGMDSLKMKKLSRAQKKGKKIKKKYPALLLVSAVV